MKVNEVPQHNLPEYYERCWKQITLSMMRGNMYLCPARLDVDELVNRWLLMNLESIGRDQKSGSLRKEKPACLLYGATDDDTWSSGKTAGIAAFRVKRHLRPKIFCQTQTGYFRSLRLKPWRSLGKNWKPYLQIKPHVASLVDNFRLSLCIDIRLTNFNAPIVTFRLFALKVWVSLQTYRYYWHWVCNIWVSLNLSLN